MPFGRVSWPFFDPSHLWGAAVRSGGPHILKKRPQGERLLPVSSLKDLARKRTLHAGPICSLPFYSLLPCPSPPPVPSTLNGPTSAPLYTAFPHSTLLPAFPARRLCSLHHVFRMLLFQVSPENALCPTYTPTALASRPHGEPSNPRPGDTGCARGSPGGPQVLLQPMFVERNSYRYILLYLNRKTTST